MLEKIKKLLVKVLDKIPYKYIKLISLWDYMLRSFYTKNIYLPIHTYSINRAMKQIREEKERNK